MRMTESNSDLNLGYYNKNGRDSLLQLENGTELRHEFLQGSHSGDTVEAIVEDGYVVYDGQRYSPSGAAKEANTDIRGKEYEINGWEWWEYFDEDEESWLELQTIR